MESINWIFCWKKNTLISSKGLQTHNQFWMIPSQTPRWSIKDLFERVNLDDVSFDLRHKSSTESSTTQIEALKRLRVVEAFPGWPENQITNLSGKL